LAEGAILSKSLIDKQLHADVHSAA